MVKKKKGFKLPKLIFLLAIIFILGIGGTLWFYALYKVAWTDYLPVEVKVPDSARGIGISVDPNLYFGDVPPGAISKKEITVWNDKTFAVQVDIFVSGEVASWIHSSENHFILEPNENRILNFFARVPDDTPLAAKGERDSYYGEVKIKHTRV